ncbi:MAG: PepSY-associated TM helix domain-containing protein [Acidobacteriota bacterium]|nr:PepSY-associated TM helix domain-containing protein [Acidobacteriota bacterium]MDP2389523.1 PepSY-associated TM helix domain-containing protein [Acidobacteriota bacterium]
MRRLLFQVHLWLGLLTGLYVAIICVTGAALVFRIDLQRALYPHLFTTSAAGPLADPVAVMESVSRAYPQHRLSGVDAPTTVRPTYLAYVTSAAEFRTVLIDPVTTAVLGELPEHPAIRTLQQLHYNLLGGRTGRTINGIGAVGILILCATGLVIFFFSRRAPRRAEGTSPTSEASPAAGRRHHRQWRQVHRAIGAWSAAFILMSAITALSFVFPDGFRSVVNWLSPVTAMRSPQSGVASGDSTPSWPQMLDHARPFAPGQPIARVVLPFGARGAFLVMFADRSPTPAGSELTAVYLDQYTGERLVTSANARSRGDAVMARMTPWHVGGVGGQAGRVIWFVFGLAPAVLFVTGLMTWWRRGRGKTATD